jgi:hypothetical protein
MVTPDECPKIRSGRTRWRTPKSAFRRYKAGQAGVLPQYGGEYGGLLEILP